jgi:hypothetical protein
MAERYAVTRLWIKHKGAIYRAGDLLPEDFTHHDRFRNLYPSRIGVVDIPDVPADTTPIVPPVQPSLGEQSQLPIPGLKPEAPEPLEDDKDEDKVSGQLKRNLDEIDEDEDESADVKEDAQTPAEPPKPITSTAPVPRKPAAPAVNKSTGTGSLSGNIPKATKPAGAKPLSAKQTTGASTGGANKPK